MSRLGSRTCSVLLLLLFFLISGFADAAAGTPTGGSYVYITYTYIIYIVYILYSSTRTRTFSIVFRTRRRRRPTYNNIRQVVFINIRYFIFILSFSHTRSSLAKLVFVRETMSASIYIYIYKRKRIRTRAGCIVR